MSFIDWSIPNQYAQAEGQTQANAAELLKQVQTARAVNALRGVDLNNPDTINPAITGLIRAGATDQATALSNLSFTRAIRQQLPALGSLFGGGEEQSSDQPPQQGLQAPQQGGVQPSTTDAAAAAQGTMTAAAGLVKDLQGVQDPAARATMFEARIKDPAFQNVDPAAIQSVRGHLGDSNFSDESLGQLLDHYQAHADNFGAIAGGGEPTQVAPHPTNGWARYLNPQTLAGIDLYKMAGVDFSNIPETARFMMGPQMAGLTAEAQVGPHLQQTLYDELIKAGIEPQLAAKTAELSAAATAPSHVVTVKIGGVDQQGTYVPSGERDANGLPVYEFKPIKAEGGEQPSSASNIPGAPAVKPGQALPPGEAERQSTDRANYQTAVTAAQDQGQYAAAQQKVAVADQAVKLAGAINPAAFTGQTGQIQNVLKGLGLPPLLGNPNSIPTYTAYLRQISRGQFSNFPRIEGEFNLMQQAAADVNTPADAAKVLLGTAAAMARKDLEYRDFVRNYKGPTSGQALQNAWLATPEAQASPFADQAFRGMTIDGKPALTGHPTRVPGKAGLWEIWRPGTPQAQPVRVG